MELSIKNNMSTKMRCQSAYLYVLQNKVSWMQFLAKNSTKRYLATEIGFKIALNN